MPQNRNRKLFYPPKLNLYNLTAYLTTTKTVYCAIWTEVQQGRTGNCFASAFKKIVDRVLSDNDMGPQPITWSDSCVAQNRNSYIGNFASKQRLAFLNNALFLCRLRGSTGSRFSAQQN